MTFSSESDEPEHKGVVIGDGLSPFSTPSLPSPSKKNSEGSGKSGGQVKKLACSVEGCQAKFSRPWRLNAHIAAKHSGQKPFACDIVGCDKQYTSSAHLRRHKANSHSSQQSPRKTYKCSFPGCSVELKTKQNERKHYRRAHEPKSFCCPHCPVSFNKHARLRSHIFIHTGVPPLKCKECNHGFTRKTELTKHLRSHRLHVCPARGCSETFKAWSAVRKHIASQHNGYSCANCNQSFKEKSSIRRHMKIHMRERTKYSRNPVHKVICDACRAPFTCKGSLRRHIAVIHEGKRAEKPVGEKKQRAKRKDAGIPKKSTACLLTNLDLPLELHKRLIEEKPIEDDDVLSHIISLQQSTVIYECQTEDSAGELVDSDSRLLDGTIDVPSQS